VNAAAGCCVWLTGLSGAGKSTIANGLAPRLQALGHQAVLFDGDVVRATLAKPLGFSREDRHANVGRVAAEAVKVVDAGGIAVCALMSPYVESRRLARAVIGAERFVLVHISTPLTTCEARDRKGLYARARRGEAKHVIGVDEEYELPEDADLRLDTTSSSIVEDVQAVLDVLIRFKFVERISAPLR
jgi:adenylyl-sulfate kinase